MKHGFEDHKFVINDPIKQQTSARQRAITMKFIGNKVVANNWRIFKSNKNLFSGNTKEFNKSSEHEDINDFMKILVSYILIPGLNF